MLVLAKEYGRPPEEVEQWDAYWFERAVLLLEGESLRDKRAGEKRAKEMKRR